VTDRVYNAVSWTARTEPSSRPGHSPETHGEHAQTESPGVASGGLWRRRRTGEYVVEIVGVAGAGKTTLADALVRRNGKIRSGMALPRWASAAAYLGVGARLLPHYLWRYRHTRWFSKNEARAIAYLEAWHRRFHLLSRKQGETIVLDHGPIYRLVALGSFGPPITKGRVFQRWWDDALRRWAGTLDLIIWLDASHDTLLERVQSRTRRHVLQTKSHCEADDFLHRYRAAYEHVVTSILRTSVIPLLKFDTERCSPEWVADAVLAKLEAMAAEKS
jgi:deoxyadenosine/deoxycytidine kinase